ncbi:sensor histidine kinase [Actinacidiphila glaucinigra]|uniref:sensor histidine kinase n=1 Tax=Actinacidiphila glaucinigra TaxID=235986 RepID=UPI00366BC939
MSGKGTWVGTWLRKGLGAQYRCAALVLRAGAGPVMLLGAGHVVLATLVTSGLQGPVALVLGAAALCFWVLLAYWAGRINAAWTRSQVKGWFGLRVPAGYSASRVPEQNERGHWWTGYHYHRGRTTAQASLLVNRAIRDQATWRDQRWLVVGLLGAVAVAVPVCVLFGGGLWLVAVAVNHLLFHTYNGSQRIGDVPPIVLGLAAAVVGLALAPPAMRVQIGWVQRFLGEGGASKAELAERVLRLTTTRADAAGSQAAELRRIERDLHDGAQARLVAIGLTLGTVEQLLGSDPNAARALLAEARESSARALQELRDLVRGIHPPVLAERGLGDAVLALALDTPVPVEVCVSLPERPPAPVEAAGYFSVCELLANAVKHSGSDRIWVDILHRADSLRITVTDQGCGGADPARGSGLRGVERRLGTFDGALTLTSPAGGPTTAMMELPCVLSSPRTSTSSGKA